MKFELEKQGGCWWLKRDELPIAILHLKDAPQIGSIEALVAAANLKPLLIEVYEAATANFGWVVFGAHWRWLCSPERSESEPIFDWNDWIDRAQAALKEAEDE